MSEFKDLLVNDTITESGLTLKEEEFLHVLYDQCKGDVRMAMDKSGFSRSVPISSITKKLSKHIKEAAKDYILANTGRAAISLVDVLTDPSAVGAKNIISASKEILDRGGVFKEEAPHVHEVRNMFILPAKDVEDEMKTIEHWFFVTYWQVAYL